MNDQSIKADEIVEALRAISTKNSISTYKRSVCKDAAALIENQAAQLAAVTAERDAARRALRLSIETHSVEPRQIERLERYYLTQASGPQGAGEGEQNV